MTDLSFSSTCYKLVSISHLRLPRQKVLGHFHQQEWRGYEVLVGLRKKNIICIISVKIGHSRLMPVGLDIVSSRYGISYPLAKIEKWPSRELIHWSRGILPF